MTEALTLGDRLARAVKHARKVKEDHVREVKGKKGYTDILTVVEAWRGAEVVCAVFLRPERDDMLRVCNLLARGFSADMLVTIMETYQANERMNPGVGAATTNPDTGESWGPGELGEYFEKHGPGGIVTEALLVSAYNRAGDEAMQTLMYRIDGRRMEWTFDSGVMDEASSGIVPDTMRHIMTEPSAGQLFGHLDQDLMDVMAVKALREGMEAVSPNQQIMVMLFAEPGSKRHQLMRQHLDRSEIADPRQWN